MSNPNENSSLHGLEIEIKAELTIVESSYPLDLADTPVTEWPSNPTDDERYGAELRGLLDAVEAVEDNAFPNAESDNSRAGRRW